ELPQVAANRGLEPRKLSGQIRGELDWIVMKCLEKDRNRRYDTANGLAQDLQRYLNDEHVLACPPSAWYRLRKLVRRHHQPLATVVLVGVALLAALAALAVSNVRIEQALQERTAALDERTAALDERSRAYDELQDEQRKTAAALQKVSKLLVALEGEQKQTR